MYTIGNSNSVDRLDIYLKEIFRNIFSLYGRLFFLIACMFFAIFKLSSNWTTIKRKMKVH